MRLARHKTSSGARPSWPHQGALPGENSDAPFVRAHLGSTTAARLESLATCRLESRRYDVAPTFLSAGGDAFQRRSVSKRILVVLPRCAPFVIQPRRVPGWKRSAFSLLEVLVAVGLLAVIIVGLLAMFYQTERAFRGGVTQVDILESARAVVELPATELQELRPSHIPGETNFFVTTSLVPMIQPRPVSPPQTNVVQEYFFLSKRNTDGVKQWTGTGYYLEPEKPSPPSPNGVGTLYRFQTNVPLADATVAFRSFLDVIGRPVDAIQDGRLHRVADRVIHLRLIPYAANGVSYTTNFDLFNYAFSNNIVYSGYTNDLVPAYIDLEFGVVEPRTFARYKSIINLDSAVEFLTNQVHRVHLFRERIPIRTAL